MNDSNMLNKALDKIKEIIGVITKLLIKRNDKLPDNFTFKNVLTLKSCVIKEIKNLFTTILEEKLVQ